MSPELLALVLVASERAVPEVQGGAEVVLRAQRAVVYARSGAGSVTAWRGREVRWRAPQVCAPVEAIVRAQADDATEEVFALRVVPGAGEERFLSLEQDDTVLLQLRSRERVSVEIDAGTFNWISAEDGCQSGLWRLPRAERPGVSTAVAFAGPSTLLGWVAIPRAAPGVIRAQAPPGSAVLASVEGWLFRGQADAEGKVVVAVEVPPGVRHADVRSGDRSQRVALASPAAPSERVIRGPDGALWLLRMDERGRPQTDAPPQWLSPVVPGAFRLSRAPWESQPLAVLASSRTAPASPWRTTAAAKLASSFGPGAALSVARAWGDGATQISANGALLLDATEQALPPSGTAVQKWVGAFAPWVEASHAMPAGSFSLEPGVGLGGALALRVVRTDFQPADRTWTVGPLATGALRVFHGAMGIEARGLYLAHARRLQSSPLAFWIGLSLRGFP